MFRPLLMLVCLALAGLAALPAAAQTCRDDAISTAPGALLFMRSGQNFQLFPGSAGIVAGWMPGDRLRVCRLTGDAYEITNLDDRGHQVKGLYLF